MAMESVTNCKVEVMVALGLGVYSSGASEGITCDA